jgi:hypothetical protein
MTTSPASEPELAEYSSEFARVCPDALSYLEGAELLPANVLRWSIEILRTLPDRAGLEALGVAWRAFIDANPEADFVVAVGDGEAISPPPAPVTVEDYYRAVLLMGMSEEDARQIAVDYAPVADRPGGMWVGDTLLYVALLSSEHEERIREYLGLNAERMAKELDRVRRSIADREIRQSGNRDQAT